MSQFGTFSLPITTETLTTSKHNNLTLFICDGQQKAIPKAGNEPTYKYNHRVEFILGRSLHTGVDFQELILYSRIHINKEEGRKQIQEDTGEEVIVPHYDIVTEERYSELKALSSYIYK